MTEDAAIERQAPAMYGEDGCLFYVTDDRNAWVQRADVDPLAPEITAAIERGRATLMRYDHARQVFTTAGVEMKGRRHDR